MQITREKVFNRLRQLAGLHGRLSYAQCGEDIVLTGLLNYLQIKKPYYLDIGAHHPKYLSNTYAFYKKGASGICVEPDPVLFSKIKRIRGRDLCLNVGIGKSKNEQADFYLMSVPTLNTFSRKDAESYDAQGIYRIKKIIKLPLISINEIFEIHATRIPDLVSIDVEGLDLEILSSIDYNRFRPKLFCVETLTYDEDFKEHKVDETVNFMKSKDYRVIADTWLNTIFADRSVWEKRVY